MSDTYQIIQAIKQIEANSYDGAKDDKGSPVKIGLKREKQSPREMRVMDGFKVRIVGDKIVIIYNSEISVKEMHKPTFQNDLETMFSKIQTHIQKEYKKMTNKSLRLSPESDCKCLAQSLNYRVNWIECEKIYSVGALKKSMNSEDNKLDETLKSFSDKLKKDLRESK